MIVIGILAAGAGVVALTQRAESQEDVNIANTAEWLETEGTIQSAAIERLDKNVWYPGFAFSYVVDGEYYSGKFFLKADDARSEDLIRNLIHNKLSIQYNPDDPGEWYIAENTIGSCEIIQKLNSNYPSDNGLYRDEGDAPVDLHLNG